MQQSLDTLEAPAPYYGFDVHYVPEVPREGPLPPPVEVQLWETLYQQDFPRYGVAVQPNAPVMRYPFDPENTQRARPLLAGTTMRLVYDATDAMPGLTAWFLRPDP